ncbi:MAG: 16S rRNA (cytosine(1402)-N(4))-methyltransferase RsmH, partial [Burkholderiaceae bacterium]|nr:16S rRNA (cytosine(1402)-N(4))-methyltransferase RsmH [Burkholderiaceae bacterium]
MQSADHLPVLLHEAVECLGILPQGLYVDATYGRGGHSALILKTLGPSGRLIAFDRDPDAVAAARQINDARFEIIHAPFSELIERLSERGIYQIDGLLADLGVSSPQLEQADRGFSFRLSGPLDMRMDPSRGEPVSAWLARASQQDLHRVISEYGEERFAFQIADAIAIRCAAAARGEAEPLDTTAALAGLVAETLKRCRARHEPGQHPATRTFQALRIYINHELEELASLLAAAIQLLRESGRVAIISFHSLEDRVVKQFFRAHAGGAETLTSRGLSRGQRALVASLDQHHGRSVQEPTLRIISRIRPQPEEVARNPRARSATLRVAERCYRQRQA